MCLSSDRSSYGLPTASALLTQFSSPKHWEVLSIHQDNLTSLQRSFNKCFVCACISKSKGSQAFMKSEKKATKYFLLEAADPELSISLYFFICIFWFSKTSPTEWHILKQIKSCKLKSMTWIHSCKGSNKKACPELISFWLPLIKNTSPFLRRLQVPWKRLQLMPIAYGN